MTAELTKWVDQIHLGDSLKLMDELPSSSIDLVVTDPPYGLTEAGGMERFVGGRPVEDCWEWDCFSDVAYDRFAQRYLKQIARVLKKGRWAYVWCGDLMPGILWRLGQPFGLKAKCVIIAQKRNSAPSWRKGNWRIVYESCIVFSKGPAKKEVLNWLGHREMEAYQQYDIGDDGHCIKMIFPMGTKTTNHPTEKPEAVIVPQILASSNKGDVVLDPFCGSGTTLAVAKRYGRHYIGIDKTPQWVEAARNRLKQGCLFFSPLSAKMDAQAKAKADREKTPLFGDPVEEKEEVKEEAEETKDETCDAST